MDRCGVRRKLISCLLTLGGMKRLLLLLMLLLFLLVVMIVLSAGDVGGSGVISRIEETGAQAIFRESR